MSDDNFVVYVNDKGFVESVGGCGITYSFDLSKAFQFTYIDDAYDVAEMEEVSGEVLRFA